MARAAHVAYGLVYHYFRNKDELLESVFAEQWTILINAIQRHRRGPGTAADKIAGIFGFVFDVYKTAPAAVRVLILEVTRTPQGLRAGSTRETFERAVQPRRGRGPAGAARAATFAQDLDPVIAASGFLGALELAVSGMVVGLVPAGDRGRDRPREAPGGGARPRRPPAPLRGLPALAAGHLAPRWELGPGCALEQIPPCRAAAGGVAGRLPGRRAMDRRRAPRIAAGAGRRR